LTSPAHRKTRLEVTLGTTLATLLVGVASIVLLAAVYLGIWHGAMRIAPESRQLAAQVNRAGNIAAALFFAIEVVAAWLLQKCGLLSLFKLHWLIKFIGLLIAVVLCSYLLVLLSVRGEAPDLIFHLGGILRHWFMSIAA
jgi:hypothetical protein